MPAVLDAPQSRRRILPLSMRAYHYLGERGLIPERAELLRGVILAKAAKTPFHVHLVCRLKMLLWEHLPANCIIHKEDPLTLVDSEPEPDLAVVRGQAADFLTQHPAPAELVIEVSISTEDTDRAKAEIYAEAGVKEYWIVLPERQRIEIFTHPTPAGYGNHTVIEDVAASAVLPGFCVSLKELFASP